MPTEGDRAEIFESASELLVWGVFTSNVSTSYRASGVVFQVWRGYCFLDVPYDLSSKKEKNMCMKHSYIK